MVLVSDSIKIGTLMPKSVVSISDEIRSLVLVIIYNEIVDGKIGK